MHLGTCGFVHDEINRKQTSGNWADLVLMKSEERGEKANRRGEKRDKRQWMEHKKDRGKQEVFDQTKGFPGEGPSLVFASVTSWGSFRNNVQFFQEHQVVCISEHHLRTNSEIAKAQNWAKQRGWASKFTEAARKMDKEKEAGRKSLGKGTGGMGVLWKTWIKVRELGKLYKDERRLSFEIEVQGIGSTNVAVVYGWSGKSGQNRAWIWEMIQTLKKEGKAFIIGGDFNWEFEEMSEWLRNLGLLNNKGVKAIGWGSTCFGAGTANALDYCIVSNNVERAICSKVKIETGLTPHKPVGMELGLGKDIRVRVDRNKATKPKGEVLIGPRELRDAKEWHECEECLKGVEKMDRREEGFQEKLDEAWMKWREIMKVEVEAVFGEEISTGQGIEVEYITGEDYSRKTGNPKGDEKEVAWVWIHQRIHEAWCKGEKGCDNKGYFKAIRNYWRKHEGVLGGTEAGYVREEIKGLVWMENEDQRHGRLTEIREWTKKKAEACKEKNREDARKRWQQVIQESKDNNSGLVYSIIRGTKVMEYHAGDYKNNAGEFQLGSCSIMDQIGQQAEMWSGRWEGNKKRDVKEEQE